jgi:hypothetical protein
MASSMGCAQRYPSISRIATTGKSLPRFWPRRFPEWATVFSPESATESRQKKSGTRPDF